MTYHRSSGFGGAVTAPGRILVVDDVAENRDVLSRRLARRGYTVLEAGDGPSALSIVREQELDLVLLDWMMPDMSGLTVLETIRESRSVEELCVVMTTCRHQREDVLEAVAAGANDYFAKPIDFEHMVKRIQSHIEKQRYAAKAAVRIAS